MCFVVNELCHYASSEVYTVHSGGRSLVFFAPPAHPPPLTVDSFCVYAAFLWVHVVSANIYKRFKRVTGNQLIISFWYENVLVYL